MFTRTNKACRGERFLTATGFVVVFLAHPEDIGEADAADAYPKENTMNEGTEAYPAQRVSFTSFSIIVHLVLNVIIL